jgi:thiol-disulfide isomerase/thioredoxin
MSRRGVRVAAIILAVAAVQVAAVVVYRRAERQRREQASASFLFERISDGGAPEALLVTRDGSTRRLSDLRGKPVLLHFWATWCPPCREELPGLLSLARELSRDGRLQLVALSLDQNWEAVQSFFPGDIPAEVMRDEAGTAVRDLGVSTLPDTYLLGPDGTQRLRFQGPRDWRTSLARETLTQELKALHSSSQP